MGRCRCGGSRPERLARQQFVARFAGLAEQSGLLLGAVRRREAEGGRFHCEIVEFAKQVLEILERGEELALALGGHPARP